MASEMDARIREAAQALKAAGAREVYLFGSILKATAGEGSDVDLAVSGLPPEVFFKAMGAARRILRRPLDLVDLDEENPFTRYLRDEGELQRVG
ncbi:MAG TPA: nucleotidyltransferase domain-containing protein [Planctomycetota bacterium]|nr:nucleotidyltransferase domain-containing protein [Planctomycetota bacterium]HRR79434.1 nucleotidyltransferase domain-containing protein [Planctomycetota bacterium]HRT95479.1 nucleotidyltransferase domain-containing protein [Planctomycetota bacterium]